MTQHNTRLARTRHEQTSLKIIGVPKHSELEPIVAWLKEMENLRKPQPDYLKRL